ncbi:MAG: folate/biopterin family MFS transporter [Cyanobacterium sp. T60_A2020_053]|nr:folate/biopterin family MFS transporter [Cyanobacterium sp. T60_A2020_053]
MFINISSSTKIKKFIEDKLLFGNELTPELGAILTVYFVQGILGLARLAVSFFLKDELMLSPAQVSALMGVAAIPWITKPLIGFLSDSKPLFAYRRRSYLVLSGVLGALAWVALATIVNSVWGVTIAILITSLSVAMSDVIVDSVVVERARNESLEKSGSLQSVTWGCSAVGGLITAYFSGLLLEFFSARQIFLITACFPLLVIAVAWFIIDQPVTENDQKTPILAQTKQLWQTLTKKSILAPVIFVALWQSTPSADSAFFFFTTNELGFNAEFLGRVRLITSLASLIGIFCYQKWLKQISFRVMLGWCVVISSLLGLTSLILVNHWNRSLGISDHWFSLGDSLVLTVMGQIAFMPVLVLSARLCPEGIEASFFALLMSIWNLGGLLSHEGGALLTSWLGVTETDFTNLWLLLLITNLSSLLPLFLIKLLPNTDPQEESKTYNFPVSEVYEHHSPGGNAVNDMMPDVVIDFIKTTSSKK